MFFWPYLVFTPSWRLERTSRFARRTRHTGNKGVILRLGLILFVWWTSRCIVHFVWRGLYYWHPLKYRSDTLRRKMWWKETKVTISNKNFLLLCDKINYFRFNKIPCRVISEDTCNQLWPEWKLLLVKMIWAGRVSGPGPGHGSLHPPPSRQQLPAEISFPCLC